MLRTGLFLIATMVLSGCPKTSVHEAIPVSAESRSSGDMGDAQETYDLEWITRDEWFIISSSEGCTSNVHVYISMIIKQGGQPFGIMARDCSGKILARFEDEDCQPTATRYKRPDGSIEWVLSGPIGVYR